MTETTARYLLIGVIAAMVIGIVVLQVSAGGGRIDTGGSWLRR